MCTRDRGRWLDGCLTSVRNQTAPASTFEVVVVDNGSRDPIAEIVRRHDRSTAVRMRSQREPRVGLSHARNAGLSAAVAPVVAFLDDDARPATGWLDALRDTYRCIPSATAVGGPIELAWTSGRPAWLVPSLEAWYSALDLGSSRRELGPAESLYGANFSVRRDLAVCAGGFDPALGRVGRRLRSGEEWALLERVRSSGPIVYDPSARVTHEVLPDRLSPSWLLRRTYAYGRVNVKTAGDAGHRVGRRVELAAAACAVRRSASDPRRLVGRVRRGDPRTAALMEELAARAVALGEARERLARAFRRGSGADGGEE